MNFEITDAQYTQLLGTCSFVEGLSWLAKNCYPMAAYQWVVDHGQGRKSAQWAADRIAAKAAR